MKRKGTPPVHMPCYAMLQSTSTWNSDTCAYVSTPLTSRGTQVLFVVNSVKLHLTALKFSIFFILLITGFSEVESKASTKPEANRKVNAKGFAVDNTRANSGNLRPPKPLQKKG